MTGRVGHEQAQTPLIKREMLMKTKSAFYGENQGYCGVKNEPKEENNENTARVS